MDARIMARVIGDAEARLAAVREWGQGQSAKAAGLDAIVTHQRDHILALEAALRLSRPYVYNAKVAVAADLEARYSVLSVIDALMPKFGSGTE